MIRVRLRVWSLLFSTLLSGCTVMEDQARFGRDWSTIQAGVMYAKREPIPDSVVHMVRVDLSLNRLAVSGPEERGNTLDAMANYATSVVSANASFFDRSFQPRGVTMSNGQTWTPVMSQQHSPLLACDASDQCHIQLEPPFNAHTGWSNVVAGTPWLLNRGRQRTALDDAQCKSLCASAHPRTAIGLDANQRYLYIVTAEGRSPPVLGLSLAQLSSIMADVGVSDAINLDGGGSSVLFVNGRSVMQRPANEPGQRKLANAIHIYPR